MALGVDSDAIGIAAVGAPLPPSAHPVVSSATSGAGAAEYVRKFRAIEAAAVVRKYDDNPDGKLELAEFAELVRDVQAGTIRTEERPPAALRFGDTPAARLPSALRPTSARVDLL